MKKILLFIVALVATLSMNAQTTEIHNETGKVASYLGADVTVKFGVDGSEPTIEVYKGDVWQKTYTGSEYKVVSTPVEETFKAVYDTNGGVNTLTFYYDAVDHSGNGITVYQDGTANYLFDNAQSEGAKWGYDGIRVNVKKVVINESVKKYEDLTSTAYMFKDMINATGISGAEYLDVANVTDMSNMFERYGFSSTDLNAVPNVSGWNTGNVKNMANMFNQYGNNSTSLTVVPDVSGWNTGNVKNMANMFYRYGYTSASFNAVPNVSEWKTDSLTDMNKMFYNYGYNSTSLTVVPDVSGWKTGNVTNMDDLFNCYGYKSTSLTVVPDVSKWNTGNVKNMANMFYGYGYTSTSLTVVPDVSGWNTDKVTNMTALFRSYGYKSTSLTVVPDVSGWKTGNVTNMDRLFDSYGYYSTSLTVVPNVSKWNTGNVENMENMFYRYGYKSGNIECVLDLSGWNLANVTSGTKVFDFKPETFSVTIPYKTGDKVNEESKWYYGDGTNYIAPPTGKTFTPTLAGVFSVSATKKVRFSKGNLQATYNSSTSTYTWGFAANQYDCIGNAPGNTTIDSQTNGAVVDFFGWSTSTNGGTSTTDNYGIKTSRTVSEYSGDFYDWGKAVGDGNTWRTLSKDEWTYLFEHHSKKWATVNGVKGYVIAPDGFEGTLSDSYADDAALAANNLVFLPAAGTRFGSSVQNVDNDGYYWSSTAKDESYAYNVHFNSSEVYPEYGGSPHRGSSVRLVKEVK